MKDFSALAVVRNKPDYPLRKYVVARAVDGDLWFWGTWDKFSEAFVVAKEIENACILETDIETYSDNLWKKAYERGKAERGE